MKTIFLKKIGKHEGIKSFQGTLQGSKYKRNMNVRNAKEILI